MLFRNTMKCVGIPSETYNNDWSASFRYNQQKVPSAVRKVFWGRCSTLLISCARPCSSFVVVDAMHGRVAVDCIMASVARTKSGCAVGVRGAHRKAVQSCWSAADKRGGATSFCLQQGDEVPTGLLELDWGPDTCFEASRPGRQGAKPTDRRFPTRTQRPCSPNLWTLPAIRIPTQPPTT